MIGYKASGKQVKRGIVGEEDIVWSHYADACSPEAANKIVEALNAEPVTGQPLPKIGGKTFEEAWEEKEEEGYKYGQDALENVRFGWKIAFEALRNATKE